MLDLHAMSVALPVGGTYLIGVGLWVLVFMKRPQHAEQRRFRYWARVPFMPVLMLGELVKHQLHTY